jgi:hypothetical protein
VDKTEHDEAMCKAIKEKRKSYMKMKYHLQSSYEEREK